MRIAMAQLNPTIGDLSGNTERLLTMAAAARAQGADLLVGTELTLTGYPPRDLLDRPAFVRAAVQALHKVMAEAPLPMVIGSVVSDAGDPLQLRGAICNGAVWLQDGKIRAC